ncbi:MAG TPA: ATP-binding cassette domain-containing protein [Acetobacteraceae bacterium]|nr:ATP-binding cassette domain-containing protein [Acetobacteraceae bacterium]
MSEPILQLRSVSKSFSGIAANVDISFDVARGEILGLIGPNGAGKSSLFNSISGAIVPDRGEILFEGKRISGLGPVACTKRGIGRTFQVVRSFDSMTVLENVMVGAFARVQRARHAMARALEVLTVCGLDRRADMPADALTPPEKRRLEVARALATEPRLLLLDEMLTGLTPTEAQEGVQLVRAVCARGITIIMVEHVMEVLLPLVDRAVVLHLGRKLAEGTPAEIVRNPGSSAPIWATAMPPDGPLLSVRGLTAAYRGLRALHGIDLTASAGEIVAVVGANGAGKSTLLRGIAGQMQTGGGIVFDGRSIARMPAHRINRLGVVLVPEGRRLFGRLSVEDNLRLGAYARRGPDRFRPLDLVFSLFPRLQERLSQRAETLSGGEQQMLAIGRALMTNPRLLMLDEPSQGIMPRLVDDILAAVQRIRGLGVTILIVEQRLVETLAIADRAYVLQTGRIVMSGPAAEIASDAEIRRAYLGM